MTDDQKRIARMEVWERYEAAKCDLLAQRARLNGWRLVLGNLALKLEAESFDYIEPDYAKLPTYDDFAKSISELKTARQMFKQASKEAKDNGFPLD